jgi:hypothetical protein
MAGLSRREPRGEAADLSGDLVTRGSRSPAGRNASRFPVAADRRAAAERHRPQRHHPAAELRLAVSCSVVFPVAMNPVLKKPPAAA